MRAAGEVFADENYQDCGGGRIVDRTDPFETMQDLDHGPHGLPSGRRLDVRFSSHPDLPGTDPCPSAEATGLVVEKYSDHRKVGVCHGHESRSHLYRVPCLFHHRTLLAGRKALRMSASTRSCSGRPTVVRLASFVELYCCRARVGTVRLGKDEEASEHEAVTQVSAFDHTHAHGMVGLCQSLVVAHFEVRDCHCRMAHLDHVVLVADDDQRNQD